MIRFSGRYFFPLIIAFFVGESMVNGGSIRSSTFLSPLIELTPGLVNNKFYLNIDFPDGHIAVKDFLAEVIDEDGHPVTLYETYLHHWIVLKYFQRRGSNVSLENLNDAIQNGDVFFSPNSGQCQPETLRQYWGLGSETRKTMTLIPDPYGIELGNPEQIPSGYDEKWMVNVHAIDTRGVVDRRGCLECRCDLYNVTESTDGKPLPAGYLGGLECCGDQYQCKMRKAAKGGRRGMYLRYTVRWVEWDASLLPVKVVILDVTDDGKRNPDGNSGCQIEYQVEACSHNRRKGEQCINDKMASLVMTTGGYVIFGVGHLHLGGRGIALHRQDGSEICNSKPIYGNGTEAGNESGYVVGMTSCYPEPGTVKINDMETVVLDSKYSNKKMHSGVMGLFYLLVADELPKSTRSFSSSVKVDAKGV